jgi:hypothetical protein
MLHIYLDTKKTFEELSIITQGLVVLVW